MQSVIYIDMLFLVNAILGYFTLKATAHLCKCENSKARIIIASVFAGFSSFVIFFQELPISAIWVYKITTCILICFTAFQISNFRMLAKRIFWYAFLNITVAGTVFAAIYYFNAQGMHSNNLAVYFDISPPILILCVVAVYLCVKLSGLLFGVPNCVQKALINFCVLGYPCTCNALLDTGFNVKDLFGGKKVFMLSLPLIKHQMPQELCINLEKYFSGESPQGQSPFFVLSVQTANGFKALPAVKVTNLAIKLNNKIISHKDAAAVFTSETLGENEFEAILGHDIAN